MGRDDLTSGAARQPAFALAPDTDSFETMPDEQAGAMTLPAAGHRAPDGDGAAPPAGDDAWRPRLLIVDDDEAICRLVGRVAGRLGFRADFLTDPDGFEAKLNEFDPQLLVLDLRMPHADGIELLRRTRDIRPGMRVVVMSGMDQRVLKAAEEFGRTAGLDVFDVLQKPIRVSELEHCLGEAIGPAAVLNGRELEAAIRERQLVMYYQPKISLRDGRRLVTGVEALIRWQHPAYGLLMPGQFLPVAERESGLMGELTDFVLSSCLEQAGKWAAEGFDLKVAVNLPTTSFQDPEFPERFSQQLAQYGVDGSSITLEVTESATMMGFPETAKHVSLRLRVIGVGLSIDDFGTGFSSLQQLYELPFSELKIDRRFLSSVPQDDEARAIVRATVSLAHALGMTACAEGVETKEALAYVEAIGCDSVQGFLISGAIPAESVGGFVTSWHDRESADAESAREPAGSPAFS